MRRWILAAAAAGWTATPLGSHAAPIEDPGCEVIPVVQRSDQVIYPLSRAFLRAGSDSLWSAGRSFARDQDYALERTRGVLRLRVPPVPGETLWVRVCGLVRPPAFQARFASYRPARTATDSAAADSAEALQPAPRPVALHSTTEPPPGTSLAIQGNKTIAVDFGSNQDAFLRQSLDLAVSGTLAPGVELTGVLSDRNTPLTATGSTRDLQSLDRLLIELRAPEGGAALGDVALTLDQGEFARVERRLQGVRGEWSRSGFTAVAAAASAEGEFNRMEFFAVEGRQGPYALTGPNGETAIAVVPGSEVVTLDGERLTRGEGADYAMDYERAQLTFTNRRPVGGTSRVTVDYQVAVNRFRRNLAAAGLRWARGAWRFSSTALTEGDDRGRPLAASIDGPDRLVLEAAGDSARLAVSSGVTPGTGDYDQVADVNGSHFAFAGPDSGDFAVRFWRAGEGQGDYADSAAVAGRVVYRYVGAGQGTYRVGQPLPVPDSHQLWDVGGGAAFGPLRVDVEGALSRLDRNTFSTRDDADNLGHAGNARLALEGRAPPWLGGRLGMAASTRAVDRRFEAFGRLERPFAGEDWGIAPGSGLDRQTRHEASAFFKPGFGGELRGAIGRLETTDGFQSWRRSATWERAGRWVTRARWERADGEDRARAFPDGGRERAGADLGLRLGWVEPLVKADWDERWSPSDTARGGARSREIGAEVRSGARLPWRMGAGVSVRRDAQRGAAGYRDLYETRVARLGVDSPAGRRWGTSLNWQRRVQNPLDLAGRTVSDLASARLSGADPGRGWTTTVGLEVTSEAESERARRIDFVGPGSGAYDSLGNFVGAGNGNYTLSVVAGPGLARVARAAGSARVAWQPPVEGGWQGSRAELVVETDARRRGALRGADAWLTPGAALGDGELSRGAVSQRLEVELAPGLRVGALRVRLERRVSADRSFTNYAQILDERNGSLRVRARPAAGWTGEVEGRLKRQSAEQSLAGPGVRRAQREGGVLGQLGYTPSARVRGALVSDLAWTRAEGAGGPWSQTWRFGPDLGLSVWTRGRLELSGRRTLTAGPALSPVLPTSDPLGVVRWESSTRFDYRLGEQTTVGLSFTTRDREGRRTEHEGRAEAKAFF